MCIKLINKFRSMQCCLIYKMIRLINGGYLILPMKWALTSCSTSLVDIHIRLYFTWYQYESALIVCFPKTKIRSEDRNKVIFSAVFKIVASDIYEIFPWGSRYLSDFIYFINIYISLDNMSSKLGYYNI